MSNVHNYLPRATDFTDLKLMERDKTYDTLHLNALCPLCRGYGYWNLIVNAYTLPVGKENCAANRAKFCHFRQACSQCDGWGWVKEEDAHCIHEWAELTQEQCRKDGITYFGKCWHVYRCRKLACRQVRAYDSSD